MLFTKKEINITEALPTILPLKRNTDDNNFSDFNTDSIMFNINCRKLCYRLLTIHTCN